MDIRVHVMSFCRYKAHRFSDCTLIFVFDGRRCPYKKRNLAAIEKRQRSIAEKETARTHIALEKVLKQLVTIDTDVLFWVKKWVTTRKLSGKIKLFGAPYEADAQLVYLESEGIVDGIITDDGEYGCHTNVHIH